MFLVRKDDTFFEASSLKDDCFLHSHFTIILLQRAEFFSHSPFSQCCSVPFVFSGDFVSVSSLDIHLPFALDLTF